MASYHRVLETFGRSIQDNTLECDCDIHPWEISINGSQWAGKIRLIGFIDVFFLISYSANARFEHGIIVYKDKLAVEEITGHIPDAKKATEKSKPDQDDKKGIKEDDDHEDLEDSEEDPNTKPEEESETKAKPTEAKASTSEASQGKPTTEEATPEFRKTSMLSITSWGHPIGLRASYPKSWIQKYKVEIMKPCSWALSKRIMRGLKPHSTYDLMNDVIRCGIITQGQLVGHIMGVVLAGTQMDDTAKRYIQGLTSGGDAGRQALSNEKI